MAARGALVEAERLLQRGDYAKAAAAFDELALEAQRAGMPVRAGDLYLQAARCHVQAGAIERADEDALHALSFFLAAGRPQRVRRLLPRMLAVLEQHGRHQEAQELRQKAERLLGPLPIRQTAAGPAGARLRSLPGKCPSCGAPLKPDQVNWLNSQSAECPFCGSMVRGE
jgi:tetratricopeptide (TPR) repeat protein